MLTTIIRQKAISTPGDSAFLASVELIEKPTTRPMTATTPRVFALSLGIWASLTPCNCPRHLQFCETRQMAVASGLSLRPSALAGLTLVAWPLYLSAGGGEAPGGGPPGAPPGGPLGGASCQTR